MISRINHYERACLTAFSPPFVLECPDTHGSGVPNVIFASPHSGNTYPDAFLSRSCLPLSDLRRNEDAFVHQLFAPAVARGAALLYARFPRCYVDVNRFEDDYVNPEGPDSLEPSTYTAWGRAGLGVVPTLIAENVSIYDRPPTLAHIRKRIDAVYKPYHAALTGLVEASKQVHARTLLIDCHSMPGFAPIGARRADIILGDRYGVACQPETTAHLEHLFQIRGYSVTRNYPYAGGFVTAHYSDLPAGVEVIQIEINRDLYLNPVTYRPRKGYDRLAHNLTDIIEQIILAFHPAERLAAQ